MQEYEIKQMPPIKKAMEGKEVLFLYLANNSPEDSWKNVIKENHLMGPQIVHYNLPSEQQELLEKYFAIRQYPTFVIIDKKGKVITTNVPHPRQTNELINRLNELVAE